MLNQVRSFGWWLAPCLALALLSGCGSGGRPSAGTGRYTVTAPLLQVDGSPVRACYGMTLVYPPTGCSGVAVHGVSLDRLGGVQRFRGGLQTPVMRLVGSWDGRALTLSEPPRPAGSTSTTRPVSRASRPPPPATAEALPGVQRRIVDDWKDLADRGTPVLDDELVASRGVVRIVVPVADAATVRFLESRYTYVDVCSWLQPA